MAAPALVVRVAATLTELKANLAEGKSQIEITQQALVKMASSYDGSRIIQQAGATAAAIEQIGGVSKLTVADQERANAVLDEALEKYRRLGREAPPGMQELADATRDARKEHDNLGQSLGQVDHLLAAFGIHVVGEVRALKDLAEASAFTGNTLGNFATVAASLGAAFAGWKVGRALADFAGTDEIIGKATAKLLGWGDAAAEAGGVKADILAQASRHVGVAVTDLSLALEINRKWLTETEKAAVITQDALARLKAPAESAKEMAAWHAELDKVATAGVLSSLTADVESHNFSQQELAERYRLSTGALQLFTSELKNSDDVHAQNAAKLKAINDELQRMADERAKAMTAALTELNSVALTSNFLGETWRNTLAGINAEMVVTAERYLAAGASQKAVAEAYGLTTAQVKALASAVAEEQGIEREATGQSIDALQQKLDRETAVFQLMEDNASHYTRVTLEDQRAKIQALSDEMHGYGATSVDAFDKSAAAAKKVEDELAKVREETEKAAAANRAMGGSKQYDLSTEEGRRQVPPDIAALLHDGYSFAQAAQLAYAMKMGFSVDRDPLFAIKGPRVPGFADGVQNFSGGMALVGERGPEIVTLPRGSDVIPHSQMAGGMTVNITVNGSVLSDQHQLANAVGDALMARLRAMGMRFPAAGG